MKCIFLKGLVIKYESEVHILSLHEEDLVLFQVLLYHLHWIPPAAVLRLPPEN